KRSSLPLEVPDVLVVLVHVDERAHAASVVVEVLAQLRMAFDELGQRVADGRSRDVDGRRAPGVGAQRCREVYARHLALSTPLPRGSVLARTLRSLPRAPTP